MRNKTRYSITITRLVSNKEGIETESRETRTVNSYQEALQVLMNDSKETPQYVGIMKVYRW